MLYHQTNRYLYKKNNGSSVEPCETPASIAAHEEYCPFRTIFALVNIRSLSQFLINYLICRFLYVYEGNFCATTCQ